MLEVTIFSLQAIRIVETRFSVFFGIGWSIISLLLLLPKISFFSTITLFKVGSKSLN